MSTPFESVVRPFQLPDNAPAVRVITPGQQEVRRVLLAFGRAGAGKVMTGTATLNKTFYCEQYVVEKRDL